MRIWVLIKGDINFQIKQGFYLIYFIMAVIYVVLISYFPKNYQELGRAAIVFSDPAAIGLFFMGAIVLLEKSQRVLNSLAVSPVKAREYVIAKVVSLAVIATLSAFGIMAASGGEKLLRCAAGAAVGAVVFSLTGILIAVRINSMNQFLMMTIPAVIICVGPVILYACNIWQKVIWFHPGIHIFLMLRPGQPFPWVSVLYIGAVTIVLYLMAVRATERMFRTIGGIKL